MASPAQYYQSLPFVSMFYGVACLMTTSALYLGLYDPWSIALSYHDVFKRFQAWRLITNFFFLGPFPPFFAIRLVMIVRYGVLLERGPFDKRTAEYVWMLIFGALSLLVMAAVPFLWSPFMAGSLAFMIVYVWSREFPNEQISIYGEVTLKGFYLPWALLALDLIFGAPLNLDIIGMVAGHLYCWWQVRFQGSTLGSQTSSILRGGNPSKFSINAARPIWCCCSRKKLAADGRVNGNVAQTKQARHQIKSSRTKQWFSNTAQFW